MSRPPQRLVRAREAWRRVPLPGLVVLALLLVGAGVDLARSRDRPEPVRTGHALGDVARASGCRLQEFETARVTNPPVTGTRVERAIALDGSFVGRTAPSVDATTHALLHGRVLIQHRPGLPGPAVRALDRLVTEDPDSVVGFENQTGMTAPVAATAYLSLLTCRRVNAASLRALGVFRDRRRNFGTAF